MRIAFDEAENVPPADLHIRLAGADDAGAVAAIYAPFVEHTPITFEAVVPDAAEMAQRIVDTLRVHPWLVCEVEGRLAGYAYATHHRTRAAYRWSVDTSVYIDPAFHRRGVGRALYARLFEILRAQGFFNAYAGITLPNPASVGLHEAVGFRPLAAYTKVGCKLGVWYDVGWWQLTLQPHVADPPDPVPFSTLVVAPAWARATGASS